MAIETSRMIAGLINYLRNSADAQKEINDNA